MVSSIQRLGLTPNATIEQRKLAVDLAEVIIKWEFQRVSISEQICSVHTNRLVTDCSGVVACSVLSTLSFYGFGFLVAI